MKKPKKPKRRPGPVARLPLPKKAEQRHGDERQFSRSKEKERLRRHSDD